MSNKSSTAVLPKQFQTQLEISQRHITTLRAVIAIMVLICAALWYGWTAAPSHLTVHIPPDLRSGSEAPAGEIPAQNVYIFATYFWKLIQRWHENGEQDYANNLLQYQSYITPRFYDWLNQDFKAKAAKGELRSKIRGITELPGQSYQSDRVVVLGDGAWLVWLDVEIKEWVGKTNTKTVRVRYPMRVVRFDIDPQQNPWGLALDGFPADQQPTRLVHDQGDGA